MAIGKYKEWLEKDNLIRVQAWCRDGLADNQIAHNIGISTETFYQWKKKYPVFAEALKKTKEVVDAEVENALYKRAIGFTKKTKVQKVTKEGQIIESEIETYYPPEVVAQIFWLKNRKPQVWRDKREIDASAESLTKLDDIIQGFKNAAKQ